MWVGRRPIKKHVAHRKISHFIFAQRSLGKVLVRDFVSGKKEADVTTCSHNLVERFGFFDGGLKHHCNHSTTPTLNLARLLH